MTVRRRILFAALAVGVVGTLAVLFWSAGAKEPELKLSFELCGYSNTEVKSAIVKVTNCGNHAVVLSGYAALIQDDSGSFSGIGARYSTNIAAGSSCTILPTIFVATRGGRGTLELGSPMNKWRLRCFVPRETLSSKLLRRLQQLPLVGGYIDTPGDYEVTSDWFSQ